MTLVLRSMCKPEKAGIDKEGVNKNGILHRV
jgi:hypothetical protein